MKSKILTHAERRWRLACMEIRVARMETAISAVIALIPWTILPLRIHTQWALDYAHIMIPCYAAFMILSGICTLLFYTKGKVKNTVMKVCLVINGAYAVFGAAVIAMMIAQKSI